MSAGKFASITAGLLARKGEARPWPSVTADEPPPAVWHPAADVSPMPIAFRSAIAAPPPPPPVDGRDKSCALRMSAHDYERLGILAVKGDTTRQQLLKQALADFLAARAAQYGCACLGACNSSCSGSG
jgi:hypothetical protein